MTDGARACALWIKSAVREIPRLAEPDTSFHGPGVAEDLRRKVLEPFFKANTARTATKGGGFGLGLSIVRDIVRSHEGSLQLLDEHRLRSIVLRSGGSMLLPLARDDRRVASDRRRHFKATLLSQFVPIARNYSALPAAMVGVAFPPFLSGTVLGAVLWNAAFLVIGIVLHMSV